MAYNPGIQYRGDVYISQAGQQISDSLMKAIARHSQIEQEDAFGDSVMHVLSEMNGSDGKTIVSPDMLNEFSSANHNQKAGLLRAAQTKAAMDAAQQLHGAQENRLNAVAAKQNALADAQTNRLNWTPSQEDRNLAYSVGGDYIQGPQGWQFQRYSAGDGNGDTPKLLPAIDPQTQQPIPGKAIASKTGQVIDTTGGNPMVGQPHYDEETGDIDGHFLADGSIRYKPKGDSAKQAEVDLLARLGGGGGSQTQAPSQPTQQQPSAPQQQVNGPQQQAALVRQKFRAGELTRDAAIAQLRALGFSD